ncbi:hypothetical protein [Streptomyces sp. NPDC049585]|uniref:hypothetical protein n=1 Tax=Streptomyces sp. NPDC049585 TaxID=3155154 RepID=UPI00341E7E06
MSKSPRRRHALRVAITSAALASAVLAPAAAAFAMDPGASTPTVPAAKPTKPAEPTVPTASTAPTTGTQPSAKPSAPVPSAPAKDGKETGKASPSAAPSASRPADGKNGDAEANELGTWRFVAQLRDGSSGNVYQSARGAYNLEIVHKGERIVIKGARGVVIRQIGTMVVTFDATTGELTSRLTASSQGQGDGTSAQKNKSGAGRFEGTAVSIGKGLVAVLRYDPANGSAEAWIRNVGPDWKPGDPYIQHVAALLNRDNVSETVEGLNLSLEGVDGPHPVLLVNGKAYAFPAKATGGSTAAGATGVKANGGTTGVVSAAAQTKVMPQGGVAAGAEGVREGNDTALLAAGGALASVSAAGVAFAVLRRRADRSAV